MKSYIDYCRLDLSLHFRRTTGHYEVDFILGGQTGIEVKGKSVISDKDLNGLSTLEEEKILKRYLLVCLEEKPRLVDKKFLILPFKTFLRSLWNHEWIDAIADF